MTFRPRSSTESAELYQKRQTVNHELRRNPRSIENWKRFFQYPPGAKSQHRLFFLQAKGCMSKFIDTRQYADHPAYIEICLHDLQLMSTGAARVTFQRLEKQKVGQKSKAFHLAYAEFEYQNEGPERAKELINQAYRQALITLADLERIRKLWWKDLDIQSIVHNVTNDYGLEEEEEESEKPMFDPAALASFRTTPRQRTVSEKKSSVKQPYRTPSERFRIPPHRATETPKQTESTIKKETSPMLSSTSSESSSPGESPEREIATPYASLLSNKNLIVIAGRAYILLEEIGHGGSSRVYRILGPDYKIYALKKIKLKRLDKETIAQYENEIAVLRSLQGNPYIIRLIGYSGDKQKKAIHLVMEHGEIDLNHKLHELRKAKLLDMNFVRLVWQQMLRAVSAIHEARVVHGDLKPANFLFVNGALKLIDFGISKVIANDTTNIEREGQVGTINFMSPEAIVGNTPGASLRAGAPRRMKVSRASDIWSLGCILYQMVYGKPPFADVGNLIQKLHSITDPSCQISYPKLSDPFVVKTIQGCLQRDPLKRAVIDGENGLLNNSFLKPPVFTEKQYEEIVLEAKRLAIEQPQADPKELVKRLMDNNTT